MQKWKRILALAGAVLLAGLYLLTLVVAFFTDYETRGLFMACLFSTFAIPVFLYAVSLVAKILKGKNQDMQKEVLAGDKDLPEEDEEAAAMESEDAGLSEGSELSEEEDSEDTYESSALSEEDTEDSEVSGRFAETYEPEEDKELSDTDEINESDSEEEEEE